MKTSLEEKFHTDKNQNFKVKYIDNSVNLIVVLE